MSATLTTSDIGTSKNGDALAQGSTSNGILLNLHPLDKEEEVGGQGGNVEENHVSDEADDIDVGNGSKQEDEVVEKDDDGDESEGEDNEESEEGDTDDSEGEEDENEVELNSVTLLKEGIIKTTENKKELTILLVGETGVGKTTMLSFIGNVLRASRVGDYVDVHDAENEATGSEKGSKTDEPRLYQYTSTNGVVLRILDTPGLADTRGLDQDKKHKENIANAIQGITAVDAVLIIANGTVPRLTVATDYTLSALSSIFPRTFAKNIGFIFTNVLTEVSLNFAQDSLPVVLRDAEKFLFDNPVALQKKYKEFQVDLEQQKQPMQQRQLEARHEQFKQKLERTEDCALKTLVNLFDWINGCEAQPTKDILLLHEQAQTIDQEIGNALAPMEDAVKERDELQKLKEDIRAEKTEVENLNHFERFENTTYHVQDLQDKSSVLCYAPGCYNNCHERCSDRSLFPLGGLRCKTVGSGDCKVCGHPTRDHRRFKTMWREVKAFERHVDAEVEKKYLAAKDELQRKKAAKLDLQERIDTLSKQIDGAMAQIILSAEEYAKLSLSGSFSSQIEKSIELLTFSIEAMQNNNSRQEMVDDLKGKVRIMKRRLEIFRNAATRQVGLPYVFTL